MQFETIEDDIIATLFFLKNKYTKSQLKDVKAMIKAYPDIDYDYIEQWIPELGLEKIYKEIKEDTRSGRLS